MHDKARGKKRAFNSTFPARRKPLKKAWIRKARPAPIRKVSKGMAWRLDEYRRIRAGWMEFHPVCGICLARGIEPPRESEELHHSRGRAGKLLCDTRFFITACHRCHAWTHEHPRDARALGVLAEPGEWNVYPR